MPSTARFGRGTIATIGAVASLSLVLAGCANSSRAPGELVIGVTTDPDTLHPWTATQFQAVNVLQNVYGTLTEFDEDLEVVPGLAESWDLSDDETTLTFQLRQDVTFNDGSQFDSADVKHSLDGLMDEDNAAVAATSLASVEEVTAVDDFTVDLELSSPDSALPSNLASVNMAMLSAGDDTDDLNTRPNGTGPYQFDSRKASQSLTLTRNDAYWGDRPTLDSIEFRVIPDNDSIIAALQSDNVQFAVFDDPVVGQIAEDLGLDVDKTAQLSYHTLQLNARQEKLSDVNVRLAIQCAIDRQEVLDTAAYGEGDVTGPITSPNYRSDPQQRPCPERDLDKAAEHLEKAGTDGVTIETIVSQGEYSTSVNEAQNLKAQLADANITLDLEVLESGTFVDAWNSGDFEAAVALNGGREDPDGMYGRYFTSDGNLNPVAGYSSDELDELFTAGRSTTDESQREATYQELGAELENNAAWIWLFTGYTYTATTDSVSGFIPTESGSLQYLRTTSVS